MLAALYTFQRLQQAAPMQISAEFTIFINEISVLVDLDFLHAKQGSCYTRPMC